MRSFFAAVIAIIAISLVLTGTLVLLVILFGFDETDRYRGHVSLLVAMSVGGALLAGVSSLVKTREFSGWYAKIGFFSALAIGLVFLIIGSGLALGCWWLFPQWRAIGSVLLGLTLLVVPFEGSVERAFECYPETWKRLVAKSAGVLILGFCVGGTFLTVVGNRAWLIHLNEEEQRVYDKYSEYKNQIEAQCEVLLLPDIIGKVINRLELEETGLGRGYQTGIPLAIVNRTGHKITACQLRFRIYADDIFVHKGKYAGHVDEFVSTPLGKLQTVKVNMETNSDVYHQLKSAAAARVGIDHFHVVRAVIDGVEVDFEEWKIIR
jgi:hypothetical protein